MALVQVKDAEGSVLDWMVAKCEGWEWKTGVSTWYGNKPWFELFLGDIPWGNGTFRSVNRCRPLELRYSTDWEKGGPIIEREKIELIPPKDEDDNEWMAVWYKCEDAEAGIQVGTSPIIAAMRCYVSSVLGDEVEVPDELI